MIATAFAPASVANVTVGYDHLGYSMDAIGDEVAVELTPATEPKCEIQWQSNNKLPSEASKNTAGAACLSLLRYAHENLNKSFQAKLWIKKGIPISSGLGGSAASAVAAVVATQHLLKESIADNVLIESMIDGEQLASGSRHYDNVIPCFKGGILITDGSEFTRLNDPGWFSLVIHPDFEVPTQRAREVLPDSVPISAAAHQVALAMKTLQALNKGDFNLLRSSMRDLLVTPHRKSLINHFDELQSSADQLGLAGFGISGAGPTLMGWSENLAKATTAGESLQKMWKSHSIEARFWVTQIQRPGARIVNEIPEYTKHHR